MSIQSFYETFKGGFVNTALRASTEVENGFVFFFVLFCFVFCLGGGGMRNSIFCQKPS